MVDKVRPRSQRSLRFQWQPSNAISNSDERLVTSCQKRWPAAIGAVLQVHLRAQLEAYPDATREEHCRLFQAEHSMKVSPASIGRARVALGWTRKKKTLIACEQNEAARAVWREQMTSLLSQDLVLVDETGSHITMTLVYAYAPRGQRAIQGSTKL